MPAIRRGRGRARRVPRPKKGNRRAYSPWSFSPLPRVPIAQPRSRATSCLRPDWLGGARRIAAVTAAAAACQAPPPGSSCRAAHPPLSQLGEPDRGTPQHKLCVSAPPRPPPCARAHSAAPPPDKRRWLSPEEMCGALQRFPETCPHYSVVPGGLRLPPLSSFAPGACIGPGLKSEAELEGARRLQVPWIPPRPAPGVRVGAELASLGGSQGNPTSFAFRFSPGSQDPYPLAILSCIHRACRGRGGVRNENKVVVPP